MKLEPGLVDMRTLALWSLLAAAALVVGCGSSDAKQETNQTKARPVRAMQLEPSEGARRLRLPGVAKAARDTDLSFRVGGPLVSLRVDTGTRVGKGQLLAEIDSRDFRIRVNTCRARLQAAQAKLAEAKLQYGRYKELVKHRAVAQAEYDRVKAAYEVAAAQAQSDAKALEEAENALADTVLRAPFSGYIHQRFVDNHETLRAGQPVASLVDLSAMEVELALSEDLLPLAERFVTYACRFDALPGRVLTAGFKEVGKKSDRASGTYPLILTLEDSAGLAVRPGMSAEVAVTLACPAKAHRFLVPLSALFNRGGQKAFVWLVEPGAGELRRVAVDILGLRGDRAEIKGQLSVGQWIVTAGVNSLRQGQTVSLLEPASPTNTGGEM